MHIGKSVEVDISDDPSHPKIIYLGDVLDAKERVIATALLKKYVNIFAFGYQDMLGMDPNVVVHNIVMKPDAKPVKQKPRRINPTQSLQIKEEIQKLLEAKFICPIDYPQWVSNMVPIGKLEEWIRVCIDFRDLNVACPKDDFPLPNIDTLVENTIGYEMLSLMDGFLGYNQIWVAPQDQHKIAFATEWGIYAYRVMLFGLTNATATF